MASHQKWSMVSVRLVWLDSHAVSSSISALTTNVSSPSVST